MGGNKTTKKKSPKKQIENKVDVQKNLLTAKEMLKVCIGDNFTTLQVTHKIIDELGLTQKACDIIISSLKEEKKKEESQKLRERQQKKDTRIRLTPDAIKLDVRTAMALKNRDKATELVSEYILDNNYIYSIRDDKYNEMWIYDNGIYVENAQSYIDEISGDFFAETYSSNLLNRIIIKIRSKTYINQDVFFEIHDPFQIAVQNGILDLKTQQLKDFTPKEIYFNKINATYDINSKCPNIEFFFRDILHEDDILVMQELFGFCLVKKYFIEKSFLFSGSGRNGKSKTCNLLSALLGKKNVSNVALENIQEKTFFLANIQNKMVNIGGDISNKKIKETSTFKSMTGNDDVVGNRKNKSMLMFKNYAKMIFACNETPQTDDNSDGFYDRWTSFEFRYKFKEQIDIDNAAEEEKKWFKLIDKNIIDKLTTKKELDGLLIWSLIGLHRLFENKKFSRNETTENVRETWNRKSNSLNVFCEDMIEESYNDFIPKKTFKQDYSNFCIKYNIVPSNDAFIKETLIKKYEAQESKISMSDKSRVSVWKKIKFTEMRL